MTIRSFLGAAALCVVATMAHAQQTRSALSAQNNSQIKANGVGAVTGTILNGLLGNIINSMGALTDTNSWTGANTFSNSSSVWNGAPIGTTYGGMYGAASGSIAVGNGSGALPLFVTLGTGVSAALQNSVNVSGGIASYPVAAGNLSGTSLPSAIVSSSLTSVGTLATGVWNATPIGTTYGGLYGATLNAIPYGGGANTLPSFASPVNNAVLATNGSGVPAEVTMLPSALTLPSPTLSSSINGLINVGPTTPVASTSSATDWMLGPSADQTLLTSEAVIWPGVSQWNELGVARTFTSSNNSGSSFVGPNVTLFAFARNTGSNNDVDAFLADANCAASNTSCFGSNPIARSNGGGLTNVKLVGEEIDWEPASADSVASGSGALFINSFNKAAPVAIQIGGAGGGSYTNGIVFSANVSGTGIGVQSGVTLTSLINTNNATYSTAAIILGTGASQGIYFGSGGFGTSPLLYGASNGDTDLNLGSSNFINITNAAGTTKFQFNAAAGFNLASGLVFSIGASNGASQTCTVNQAKTLIFTGGILTGGTCNS